jgi:hypothetical protein
MQSLCFDNVRQFVLHYMYSSDGAVGKMRLW